MWLTVEDPPQPHRWSGPQFRLGCTPPKVTLENLDRNYGDRRVMSQRYLR